MRFLKKLWEWISRAETISDVIHTEFVRTWLWPIASAMITGASGLLGGVPIMWVLVATAIVFMAVTIGILALLALKMQNSPQNKLTTNTIFQHDLTPREAPLLGNRKQRRAQNVESQTPQMLSSSQINPNVTRTLDKVQLGVEVRNNALFPISCFVVSADTEVEDEKPPRSAFPKPSIVIPAGSAVRFLDDRIDMEQFPCQRLAGKIDMLLKYGYPGNEIFEIHIKGSVDVIMESFGFVSAVVTNLLEGKNA